MAVETVPMFRVVCDRCKTSAQDGGEFYAWAEPEQAVEDAEAGDWLITDDGHHYCDDCTTWDDEKDELVPLGADNHE